VLPVQCPGELLNLGSARCRRPALFGRTNELMEVPLDLRPHPGNRVATAEFRSIANHSRDRPGHSFVSVSTLCGGLLCLENASRNPAKSFGQRNHFKNAGIMSNNAGCRLSATYELVSRVHSRILEGRCTDCHALPDMLRHHHCSGFYCRSCPPLHPLDTVNGNVRDLQPHFTPRSVP
jgi:hypothetical protein